ncbi:hypothetical protein RCL1_000378 [Eukaryota sp. TZLM3-RCL]
MSSLVSYDSDSDVEDLQPVVSPPQPLQEPHQPSKEVQHTPASPPKATSSLEIPASLKLSHSTALPVTKKVCTEDSRFGLDSCPTTYQPINKRHPITLLEIPDEELFSSNPISTQSSSSLPHSSTPFQDPLQPIKVTQSSVAKDSFIPVMPGREAWAGSLSVSRSVDKEMKQRSHITYLLEKAKHDAPVVAMEKLEKQRRKHSKIGKR